MRNLFCLLILVAFIASCNKKTTAPPSTSSGPPPSTSSTPTTIPAQQAALVNNWKMVRELYYYTSPNDSLLWYINHYTPTTCYLNLTATSFTPVAGKFEATGSMACTPVLTNQYWSVPSLNNLEYTGLIYPIVYLSNDSLVLWYLTTTNMKIYSVYNKTGAAPAMSTIEKALNSKTWVAKREDVLNGAGGLVSSNALVTNTMSPTYYDCQFKGTWTGSNTGFDLNGTWVQSATGGNCWEEINGSLVIGGSPWKIDTLNTSKLVISKIFGTSMGIRIQFQ